MSFSEYSSGFKPTLVDIYFIKKIININEIIPTISAAKELEK